MVFGAIRYGQDVQQEVSEMMDVLDKNRDGFIDYKGESLGLCVQAIYCHVRQSMKMSSYNQIFKK